MVIPDNKWNVPLAHPENLWQTRFGFFWYNDQELFHDSDEDIENKVLAFKKSGINHLITFSCTHFRWSFRKYWDIIKDFLMRFVRICHKHGIYVTEHHSSHLTYNPLDDAEKKIIESVLSKRHSSTAVWDDFWDECDADPEIIDGYKLSSFRQISGLTGKWARSSYQGWCMCFNNPHYRKAYFLYLESIYAAGIDGIMTDDVQWFGLDEKGNLHACACKYCRKLFREKTGLQMPEAGDAWQKWYNDYSNPSFRAWLDFRLRSNEDFHYAVMKHYRSCGRDMLRPNYIAHALNSNPTAYTLEKLPALHWVFQESCFSSVIRYSWPAFAVEQAHRRAIGRCRNIPSMEMFYPDREDSTIFTWGLAMSWGALFLATSEGETENKAEKKLRDFEKKYDYLLQNTNKIATVGIFNSKRTRELYCKANTVSMHVLKTWAQTCLMNNIPFDLIEQQEILRISDYPVIILPVSAILNEDELEAFSEYVKNGGVLLWVGLNGILDKDGAERSFDPLEKYFDISRCSNSYGDFEYGKGRITIYPLNETEELKQELSDLRLNRYEDNNIKKSFINPFEKYKKQYQERLDILNKLIPENRKIKINNAPGNFLISTFVAGDNKLALHLVNACKTLEADEGRYVSHNDLIPFPELTGCLKIAIPETLLRGIRLDGKAVIYCLEKDNAIDLKTVREDGIISLEIPLEHVSTYGLVELS